MVTIKLRLDPRLKKPDAFYKALADLHEDASVEQSLVINAKLVFILANHIGDHDVLMEAIAAVKANDAAILSPGVYPRRRHRLDHRA